MGDEEVRANDGISLEIHRGEFVAIVGKSGSGKSTLMKCLFGIEEITDGKIFLNGEELHLRGSQDAIRHGIGIGSSRI